MKPSLYPEKILEYNIMWKRMLFIWCLMSLSQENTTWLLSGISTWTSSSKSPEKHRYCRITWPVDHPSIQIELHIWWRLPWLCDGRSFSEMLLAVHFHPYFQNSRDFSLKVDFFKWLPCYVQEILELSAWNSTMQLYKIHLWMRTVYSLVEKHIHPMMNKTSCTRC